MRRASPPMRRRVAYGLARPPGIIPILGAGVPYDKRQFSDRADHLAQAPRIMQDRPQLMDQLTRCHASSTFTSGKAAE